ncbi:MAG: GNAT family N-acetyltransferase [Phycisphaeraceae bacterium]|nr:GNAT family N-acetyltransferase [Phycisphaerae bacterium]MBX3392812.1 GNAT family N-acetyltransferase [Phycisphaeraceae bacterium]HRJ50822.1 GNAT family N-acetyltransferase [Phycisphaerales bacterium]
MAPGFEVVPADTPARLGEFRRLCREYAGSLPFSLCFQGFDEEMDSLPGKYAPPMGRLYLAVGPADSQRGVGCGAIRPIAPGECELKRMYVSADHRGLGIGRAIALRLIEDARRLGYDRVKLDTSADMAAAQGLYRSLGFLPTDRYNDDPLDDTLYFALDLRAAPGNRA